MLRRLHAAIQIGRPAGTRFFLTTEYRQLLRSVVLAITEVLDVWNRGVRAGEIRELGWY